MKNLIFVTILCLPLWGVAQNMNKNGTNISNSISLGTICLNPIIYENSGLDGILEDIMYDKLFQIVTRNGIGGRGVDNRFVITSNMREISSKTTTTIPNKTVVRLSVTVFVGDEMNGTLFSSVAKDIVGVGNNYEEARIDAIRNLPTNDYRYDQCLELGKNRILSYYNQMSPGIIASAEAFVADGNYEEAISKLFTIPMQCKLYQKAQSLIVKYEEENIEKHNQSMLVNAQAAWGTSPNEDGAELAKYYLNQIEYPSTSIYADIDALCTKINYRLSAIADQKWKMEMEEIRNRHEREMKEIQNEFEMNKIAHQNQHEENMADLEFSNQRSIAYINAAVSVARAYVEKQPRVVHVFCRWW